MKVLIVTLLFMTLAAADGGAQTRKPRTLDELANYTGSDRQQILVDGAKAEGKVVWYTSLSGVYRDMVDAFKKRYPFIEVEVYRGGNNDLTPRIINEAQAGRPVADALESTPGLLMALRDRGLLKAYVSPEAVKFPDEAKGKADGARVFWVTDREAYMGFGYNTRMVAPNEVPRSYQDLLRPELKGKIAVTTESSSSRVIGTMLKYRGEEYLKRLRGQEVRLFKASSAGFLDLIAAGEVGGGPVVFQNQVAVKKERGAPVDWVPLDVAVANAGGSALVNNAPHPHAGLLFIDFVLGAEGQRMMEQFRYGVAWKDYSFKREYPERGMTSADYERAEDRWMQATRLLTKR